MSGGPLTALIFYALASLTLGSGLAVVMLRNLVHSALFLVLSFVGVAGVYLMLGAQFLAAAQVLIYIGAISVLILFGIMLTRRANSPYTNADSSQAAGGLVAAGLLFAVLTVVLLATRWPLLALGPDAAQVAVIGRLLLGPYLVPFEVASVLLLVALVGALALARRDAGETEDAGGPGWR
jgi:NADH-quinone oxidoreductase subunit J